MKTLPEIRFAILLALLTLLWLTLEYALGIHSENLKYLPVSSLLYYALPVIIIVQTIKARKSMAGVTFTYGQAFRAGLLAILFGAVLCAGVQYVFYTYINQDYFKYRVYFDVHYREVPQGAALAYYRLQIFLIKDAALLLVFGSIAAAIAALKMKTAKPTT